MNVLIIAMFVNIALVNARTKEYSDLILQLLQGRRINSAEVAETNEAVNSIPMQRFLTEAPVQLSKLSSEYTEENIKYLPVSSGWNNIAPRKKKPEEVKTKQIKVETLFRGSKNDYLTAKIFKAIESLAKPQESILDKKQKQYLNTVSKDKDQVLKLLLAKMAKGIKKSYNLDENEKYADGMGSSNTFSYNADKVLIKKWLMNKLKLLNEYNLDGGSKKHDNIPEQSLTASSTNENYMEKILKAIDVMNRYQETKKYLETIVTVDNIKIQQIVIEANPHSSKSGQTQNIEDLLNGIQDKTSSELSEELDNNASEIWDGNSDSSAFGYRRHIDKEKKSCESESEVEESDDEDNEKNPGNPFTIHKNKYKQNWAWNHYMDGDHMNINQFGPQFTKLGPSGPELFFGRKWWYFNQDDYKPMR